MIKRDEVFLGCYISKGQWQFGVAMVTGGINIMRHPVDNPLFKAEYKRRLDKEAKKRKAEEMI